MDVSSGDPWIPLCGTKRWMRNFMAFFPLITLHRTEGDEGDWETLSKTLGRGWEVLNPFSRAGKLVRLSFWNSSRRSNSFTESLLIVLDKKNVSV